ncbi:tyrosine-type recombinase/integrase [Rossellomorea sp. YZS02]|uniref:tyrosine-type recombinase/integrase n=1 Tax=Rossellomorea sp. YZS02 TaxID=3097358 RepID=UPI002A12FD5B|nr:tyrosine-type recombinase/integrase [Rossellomorea sp. YZS02]MDX8343091.1 tyrosine-type recombinase/integrase [Rossellomorea sp. YZS02]
MQGSSSTTIDQFLTWLEHEGKSSNTISTYHQELKKFEKWLHETNKELAKITQKDVQKYIYYLEDKGKSPITNDKILGVIRTFGKFLKKPDITFDIKIQQCTKTNEIDVLSQAECDQLLAEVEENENERNVLIVYMLLHTGMRVSELCSLNKTDIDLQLNQLSVKPTSEDERIIPLSEGLKHHLLKYFSSAEVEKALFVSKSGDRLTERSVQYMLKKYGVNAQKLRHTFCQQLIDKGVSLEIVSKLAGHKDINVTKKYARSRVKEDEFENAIRSAFSRRTLN